MKPVAGLQSGRRRFGRSRNRLVSKIRTHSNVHSNGSSARDHAATWKIDDHHARQSRMVQTGMRTRRKLVRCKDPEAEVALLGTVQRNLPQYHPETADP